MPQQKKEDKPIYWHPIHSVKEQRQNRIIIIGFIITAVLILGLAGYAVLYDRIFKNNIPVAKVNGVAINNNYFKDRVRLERNSYLQQYSYLLSQYQFSTQDQASQDFFLNQLSQIQTVLDDKDTFGKIVLDNIVSDEIIKQQAEAMGISVSDTEVEDALQGLFNYFPNGTPTPEPTLQPYATPVITNNQKALLKYTPTPADFTNEEASQEAVPTETTSDSDLVPTATVYTEALYQEAYQNYMINLEAIDVSEKNFKVYLANYLLAQKVFDKVVSEVNRDQEQVWARHILVKTKAEADLILARIAKGEDWSVITSKESLDTSNKDKGGDLGWFARGRMVDTFETAVFELSAGEISQPIETQFGWHIIQVLDHQTFPVSEADYQALQSNYYNNWISALKEKAEIKINDVYKEITPTEPSIPEANRIS